VNSLVSGFKAGVLHKVGALNGATAGEFDFFA
jgi:hypothetical protein